ncbi:Pyoverdine/dityrosine biosynthesis protein-domain-containing protein [Xylaria castorea]|nr:Pyoverdine/dityrosine biosynthesis protein-domain-containing protein [Xylaria castorea]
MNSVHTTSQSPTLLQAKQPVKASLQNVVIATACSSNNKSSDPEGLKGALQEKCSVGETNAQTHEATANKVLAIIASYGIVSERDLSSWDAVHEFMRMVTEQIATGAPVRMLLPGFPFKESSKNLVLGPLPDLGEELALAHLQGLCDNILAIYENGAEIIICSDGLVYNDLMGVSEEAVWEYGEALRAMATRNESRNIKFIRLWDLLEHPGRRFDRENQKQAKAYYLEHATCIRRELIHRYGDAQFDANAAVRTDKDWATTHAAYIGVLARKATESPESLATQMIHRGKAYGAALRASLPDYVRLSIHDSAGKGKFSLALIPGSQEKGSVGLMPWRSAIAVDADGSYRAVYPDQVRDTHELIYKGGQPYFFRVKSDLFDWSSSGLQIDFEHLYPCGIIVRPVNHSPSMRLIPMDKVRHLSNHFSPVVLRGFSETLDEDVWVKKGHELGKILNWALTGTIFKVVNTRDDSKMANNVTSNEPLPMHFDGIFKFEDREDQVTGEVKKVLSPPGYQYFTCLATAPKGDGYTLFCNSRLFFRFLPAPWTLERLEPVTWEMTNDGFWSNVHKSLPLVVRHPVTNAPCVRWHSPWNGAKTKYSTYKIVIENEEQYLVQLVEKLTYDFRTCLRLSWEKGDLLVNDNVSMLHTRTSYTSNCDREMWRIHLDQMLFELMIPIVMLLSVAILIRWGAKWKRRY